MKTVPGKLAIKVMAASAEQALPLLILENNWNCRKQKASIKQGEMLEQVRTVMMKWISIAMSAWKYEGWENEGILH
jgi:hypothetical protein